MCGLKSTELQHEFSRGIKSERSERGSLTQLIEPAFVEDETYAQDVEEGESSAWRWTRFIVADSLSDTASLGLDIQTENTSER